MGNGVAMVMRLGMPSLGSPRESLSSHTQAESEGVQTFTDTPALYICGRAHTPCMLVTQACRSACTLRSYPKAEGSRPPPSEYLGIFSLGSSESPAMGHPNVLPEAQLVLDLQGPVISHFHFHNHYQGPLAPSSIGLRGSGRSS